ncbi:DMT family transporter [Pareuzebyella sediminis]|uniref:DMT family transporter n=1 Tax=Pareuzebyella sediminis TaxID=2607998 RepID=UPI0011EFD7BF|nr:DMT family transporter [Pareuzebyella sediminis]
MAYLALSILASSLIFVIFKLFSKHGVQTIYAIVVNYFIAGTMGFILYNDGGNWKTIIDKPWFWGTLLLGVLFIVVFNLMAITSQRSGVSVASVATKMSLVIPVLFGVVVYKEELGALKVLGIFLALAAVYFSSIKQQSLIVQKASLVFPVLVFLGSGIIDTSIKYIQEMYINENEYPLFSAAVFGSAAFSGTVMLSIKSLKKPLKFNSKNILGGIALGIPNYFSIYFLLKALENETLNSASIFTINNVAIVMFSTLLGILLFKEKISLMNWAGIALAILSIVIVALF